jgi:hypothetical protein
MWLLILVVVGFIFVVAMSIFGGGIFTLILVPLFLVGLVAAAGIAWARLQAGDDAPEVSSSQPQPTGLPRAASGGPGTANERVGQT